ncbi:MAG: virulence factor [Rhodobacteraceae bacterium]|nr:virulence factor [Paracoccaceae bacterium]
MPNLFIVYWRDIPAQIIVGKGRRAAKIELPDRFQQAIDACAMRVGAKDTDAYLAEWRKSEPVTVAGDPEQIARDEAERIEREFSRGRLRALVTGGGKEVEA